MKLLKYKIVCNTINEGTVEEPIYKDILLEKKITYNEVNLIIAQSEAYNGEYTIIDDGEPEPEEIAVPIEFGGTGAKTPKQARENLGVVEIVTGTYTAAPTNGNGNATTTTFVDLGKEPKAVLVSLYGQFEGENGSSRVVFGGLALKNYPSKIVTLSSDTQTTPNYGGNLVMISGNGFYAYGYASFHKSDGNLIYQYIAWF